MLKHDHKLDAELCNRKADSFKDGAGRLFLQAGEALLEGNEDKAAFKLKKANRMYHRSKQLRNSANEHARRAA